MAAPGGAWRSRLNSHPIFDVLKKKIEWLEQLEDSKKFLVISDGRLFLWNPHSATVCTINIKALLDHDAPNTFQTLLCSNPPVFSVEEISLNRTDQFLLLSGRQGVSVLQLPQKWGKGSEYEGGKAKILCKTLPIGERFFSCSKRTRILQAAWHPGSDTDTHIMALTSDNCLRIYNLMDAVSPEQTIQLGDSPQNITNSSFSLVAALGNQAVAFDFGSPEELQRKHQQNSAPEKPLVWPVYLLWADGDVYTVQTSINVLSPPLRSVVRGPLVMLPPAEDNYGADACSLLCLPSQPPILIIGTPAGKLYHCCVLNRDEADTASSASLASWSEKENSFYEVNSDPTLYLYETVELELSLTTVGVETDSVLEDDYACPIRLLADPENAFRYHCYHSAGVHSVVLPWAHRFSEFVEDLKLDSMEPPDQEAIVEHLVCTKPHTNSPACPVLGLAVTAEHLLGPTLVCVTSSAECICLPLESSYRSDPPALLSSTTDQSTSPLRKLHKEPFDIHIQKILARNTVNPLIKTSKKTELSSQECFQLLSRATQVYREEYIQKLDLAQEEIQRRLFVLQEQKEYQQEEMAAFCQEQNKLRQNAENLAEKYEDAREKQEHIIYRIETVLKKLQSRLPMMSHAERQMNKELRALEEKLGPYKQAAQQLKTKLDYQRRQMKCEAGQGEGVSSPLTAGGGRLMNKDKEEKLSTVLKDQSGRISQLVGQLKDMKVQMHV